MGSLARLPGFLVAVPMSAAMALLEACGSFGSADVPADGDASTNPSEASATDGDGKDAGVDAGRLVGCMGLVACKRYVFVTSQAFTGADIGGLAGADAKCTAAAQANPKLANRTWRAWLSTSTNAATTRIPHGADAYRRVDDVVIANDWDDLVDATLASPIDLTEKGASTTASVWTGTAANGTGGGQYCNNWQAGGSTTGVVGNATSTAGAWSNASQPTCSNSHRLYCFEY